MEHVSTWSSEAYLRLELSVAHEASSKPAGGTSIGKLNFNVSYTVCALSAYGPCAQWYYYMVRMLTNAIMLALTTVYPKPHLMQA